MVHKIVDQIKAGTCLKIFGDKKIFFSFKLKA